jgi:hypothetical protein
MKHIHERPFGSRSLTFIPELKLRSETRSWPESLIPTHLVSASFFSTTHSTNVFISQWARAKVAIPAFSSSRFHYPVQELLFLQLLKLAPSNKIAFDSLFPKSKSTRSGDARHFSGSTWGRITFAGSLHSVGTIRKIHSISRHF